MSMTTGVWTGASVRGGVGRVKKCERRRESVCPGRTHFLQTVESAVWRCDASPAAVRSLQVSIGMPKLPPEQTAAPFVPRTTSLEKVRSASRDCRGCELYKRGTQTVFGAGPKKARVMIVGEQPGDQEDQTGLPFVGPAGRMLDKALVEAGIDRDDVYVTNAVKHFKWEPRGKRRIHKKPNATEIEACRPWLDAELAIVQPQVIVCLGATAAQALLGRSFKVTERRGEVIESPFNARVTATVHPSSLLRAPDDETRRREIARFIDDIKQVAALLDDQ